MLFCYASFRRSRIASLPHRRLFSNSIRFVAAAAAAAPGQTKPVRARGRYDREERRGGLAMENGNPNWRPTQGPDPTAVAAVAAVAAAGGIDPNAPVPAGGDWRSALQPEARSRIVNKIMETLKKHFPASLPGGLNELQKIAVRFEEKTYTAATDQSEYLRKISLKMLSMETKTQQNPGNTQVIQNQNPPGPGINPTSTLQNMSGIAQNTMNNGLAQGGSQDICTKANGRKAAATTISEPVNLPPAANVDEAETAAEFTYATTYSATAIFVAVNTDAILSTAHDANIIWPPTWAVNHSTDTTNCTVSSSGWYSTESIELSTTICAIITPATYTICYEAAATLTTLHA
ncbi:hypothetical protein GUJ93_ZPchr0010g8937 [Zizania palustris]|uniref:Mediator complex subunit 15 KIX domain-containing protein n=1 Tax=Zizania palustris TaxID=103762 RepID=A0A8J6BI23_ZIZPA|nr:hypothetical protein GUJ93_ZPchr0010g8937 [Zizania palustris]